MEQFKNPLDAANSMIEPQSQQPQPMPDEEGVGKVFGYKPYVRKLNDQGQWGWDFDDNEIRARKLNNGLAVETKKNGKNRFYAGSQGQYKVVDVETGLMVGWAKDYEDALRMSKDNDLLEKIKRAKEVRHKIRHEN